MSVGFLFPLNGKGVSESTNITGTGCLSQTFDGDLQPYSDKILNE